MNSLNKLLCVAVVALIVGCGHKEATDDGDHAEHVSTSGATFNEKRGVTIPAETAKFIGLSIVDVEERPITTELRFGAQVIRSAAEAPTASLEGITGSTALASGEVTAEDARRLRTGQAVTVDVGDRQSRPGKIIALEPHHERTTIAHVDVEVAIEDPHHTLKAGTFTTVKAPSSAGAPVVAVPRGALLKTTEGTFAYTVSGEHFVRAAVKVGAVNADHVEITDGLYSGDRVVAAPVMMLWMTELQAIRGGKACADSD